MEQWPEREWITYSLEGIRQLIGRELLVADGSNNAAVQRVRNRRRDAREHLREIIQEKRSARALFLLARLYLLDDEPNKAFDVFLELQEHYRESIECALVEAFLYDLSGHHLDAYASYVESIRRADEESLPYLRCLMESFFFRWGKKLAQEEQAESDHGRKSRGEVISIDALRAQRKAR